MRDRRQVYLEIWSRIENLYFDGYLAYERTLQAALYAELRNTLPAIHVVAEPVWNVGDQQDEMRPDLVIVEKGQITDIFELKFWNANLRNSKVQKDIKHLLLYGANNETYPVRLKQPNTGGEEWEELPVPNSCRLHFVVVAMHGNNALCPKSLRREVRDLKERNPELNENPRVLSHWFGRLGGDTDEKRKWSIEVGIR